MATNKRIMLAQVSHKELESFPLTIPLPTTSANVSHISNTHTISGNHHRHHHLIDQNNNSAGRYTSLSNNTSIPTFTSTTPSVTTASDYNNQRGTNLLNYCHHQAATRALLTNHRQLQHSNNRHNHHNHHNRHNQYLSEQSLPSTETNESVTPPPHYHEIPGIVPAYQGRTSGPPPAYDDVVNPNAPPPTYQSLFGQVREARKTSNGFVDLFRQLFLILIGTIGCTMIIGFLLLIPITMILVGFFYVNDCRAENIPSFLVIGGIVWIIKNILNCYNQFKKDSSTVNRPPPRRTPISRQQQQQQVSSQSQTTSAASVLIVATPPDHQQQQQTVASNDLNGMPDNTNVNQISAILTPHTATTDNRHESSTPNGPHTGGEPPTRPRLPTTTTMREHNINHIRHPPMIGLTSYKCESILNYFLIVWFLTGCIVVYRIYEPEYDNPLSASYCNRTVYLYAFWLVTSAFIIMAIVLSCLCCLMASSLMSCNHGR